MTALFNLGFRPFFLGAGVFASLSMAAVCHAIGFGCEPTFTRTALRRGCAHLIALAIHTAVVFLLVAWPLALLAAYGVALVAWDRQPPIPVIGAEIIALVGGFIAASVALGIAGSVAGHPGFARGPLMADFLMTAMLYPLVRFVIVPASIRVSRR